MSNKEITLTKIRAELIKLEARLATCKARNQDRAYFRCCADYKDFGWIEERISELIVELEELEERMMSSE